jgi:molybdate/tungstate transport system substrate-binding protein
MFAPPRDRSALRSPRLARGALVACASLCACAAQESSAGAPGPGHVDRRSSSAGATRVHVGVAASLRAAFEDLARDFEARNPGVTVRVESGASNVLCRKALDFGPAFDILVLADASLFSELLEPRWTDHHVLLATDRLVVVRSADARESDRVSTANLSDVLLGEGIRIGMADPHRAPLGYRTLLAMQLLERHTGRAGLADGLRTRVGARFVWPDAAALVAHVQSGELDYAFLYAAGARDAGLSFTELPPEASLGSLDHARAYAEATVAIAGLTPGSRLVRRGEPIAYGAALAKGASADPVKALLMAEMIGTRGADALARHGLSALRDHPRRLFGHVPASVLGTLTARKSSSPP